MKVLIASDLHFGHANMIKRYRGFDNVEDHDKMIISNWNETVNKKDKVYLLGDLSMEKDVSHLIKQLNGNIVLIPGNHDKIGHVLNKYSQLPNIVGIGSLIKYKGFWLSHAPIHPKELRGLKNIHGHTHENHITRFFGLLKDKRYINVCMDVRDYRPVEFKELIK